MDQLPIWAQNAGAVTIIIVTTLTAIFNYFKITKIPEIKENTNEHHTTEHHIILKEILVCIKDSKDSNTRDIKRLESVVHDVHDTLKTGIRSLHKE